MKTLKKYYVYILVCILISSIVYSVGLTSKYMSLKTKLHSYDSLTSKEVSTYIADKDYLATDVIKTVDHVVMPEDFKQIYSDAENDIAYYIYTGDRGLAKAGDTVLTVNGDKTTIINCTSAGFTVESPELFVTGMSGSAILNEEGDTIGYVSMIFDNKVFCVWR